MLRTAAQKFNTFTAVELTPTKQYLKKYVPPKNIPHCCYRGQFISAYEGNSHLLWGPNKTHTYTGHKAVVECCHTCSFPVYVTDLNENHILSVLSFNAWNSLCLVGLKFLPSVEHMHFCFTYLNCFACIPKLFTSKSVTQWKEQSLIWIMCYTCSFSSKLKIQFL